MWLSVCRYYVTNELKQKTHCFKAWIARVISTAVYLFDIIERVRGVIRTILRHEALIVR